MPALTIDQDGDSIIVVIETGDVEIFLCQPSFTSQSHQVQHCVCRPANCVLYDATTGVVAGSSITQSRESEQMEMQEAHLPAQ